jgi:CRISPR-associated protein Cmr6
MRNLHKLFYKDYFKDVGFQIEEDSLIFKNPPKSNELLKAILVPINKIEIMSDSFPLKTLYPGLITGVGIDHEAGIQGEFKLGLHFDYTHGMPVIYGSSVKGVLRSAFVYNDKNEKVYNKKYLLGLKDEDKEAILNQTVDVEDLFMDIFEGKKRNIQKDKHDNGKLISKGYDNKPIYDRDIFFDAVILKPNGKGKFLDSDTLCPHGDNPLKNPIPISFLKISSGVTIEFRFKLVDSTIGNIVIKKKDKIDIFKAILTTVGIGAKTNVGYGQLSLL